MTALLITAEGNVGCVAPANKEKFSLSELQTIIDGYVARFQLSPNYYCYVDEDGVYKGLKKNDVANSILTLLSDIHGREYVALLGNVLIVHRSLLEN